MTSADSGALVMANLSSHLPDTDTDAKPSIRVLWALVTGLLTIAMLTVDGIPALQNATIIMGLPFGFIMILVMISLYRALSQEHSQTELARASVTSLLVGREAPASSGSWRRRLSNAFGAVGRRQATHHLEKVVLPAMEAVRDELSKLGFEVEIVDEADTGIPRVLRQVTLQVADPTTPFEYQVRLRRVPVPSYGARIPEADDTTVRVEVQAPGIPAYDLITYGAEQVCHDILDAHERHLTTTRELLP